MLESKQNRKKTWEPDLPGCIRSLALRVGSSMEAGQRLCQLKGSCPFRPRGFLSPLVFRKAGSPALSLERAYESESGLERPKRAASACSPKARIRQPPNVISTKPTNNSMIYQVLRSWPRAALPRVCAFQIGLATRSAALQWGRAVLPCGRGNTQRRCQSPWKRRPPGRWLGRKLPPPIRRHW
jgi:hypothetical protein